MLIGEGGWDATTGRRAFAPTGIGSCGECGRGSVGRVRAGGEPGRFAGGADRGARGGATRSCARGGFHPHPRAGPFGKDGVPILGLPYAVPESIYLLLSIKMATMHSDG